ncbi:hypothetical protein LINPERHAP2_LOCUS15269 [Linum perenne]
MGKAPQRPLLPRNYLSRGEQRE